MRIVLIKNVENVGFKGEVKEVKDGFAVNYLIPQKFAIKETDPEAKRIKKRVLAEQKKKEKELGELKELVEAIAKKTVILKKKISSQGKLFAAVTPEEVARELSTKETKISAKQIEMSPIKEPGEYNVSLNFGQDVHSVIKLKIEEIKK